MKLYTISEFAEKLGVSVSTLRAWDKEGNWLLYVPQLTNEGILKKCSTGHWA
ncbi:MerR family DNA-binding transcriptional regulator [Syntrophothermus sp.]|uniref:MerR family transcriptional regulator n=1 Tax=Syntrophothermus sp. TaxID=2736299 RepID=UPI00257F1403|nr:MerR family DNA-binding transcriptional regulator [Syntrophothermus sp.]